MTPPPPPTIPPAADAQALARRLALGLVLALTLARLAVLLVTPLELYPDEAQYWLWSRRLAFGYFSKPPMVAWLIALTTGLGGDAEPYVRASAVFLNAGTATILFFLGRRLYGAWTGALACVLYVLMPGVAVSSLIISTDAPLLFFAALALLAYARLPAAGPRSRAAMALLLGLALGLAMLSKYAALYLIAGLALHLVLDRQARAAWTWPAALAAGLGFSACLGPNLAWNAAHQFQTLAHTAANADLARGARFNLAELGEFLAAQLGVFGPIPLLVLAAGTIGAIRARRLESADRLLLCAAAPALVTVSGLALLSRANANWAAVAYVPACLLVAAWLLRWRVLGGGVGVWAKAALVATLALQAAAAGLVLAAAANPRLADGLGAANSLTRGGGWRQTREAIVERATLEQVTRGLSAVAIDDRLAFNAVRYYGRDYFDRPDAAPLRKWSSPGGGPISAAEAQAGLTPADGRRVLAVSVTESKQAAMAADFATTSDPQINRVFLDRKHARRIYMVVGEGFRAEASRPPAPPPPKP